MELLETKFYIEGSYNDIEFFIDILSNTLNNFYIDKSSIEVERKAVIQELTNYMADSEYILDMKIWRYMFFKYSYQRDYKKHINFIKNYNANNLYKYYKDHIINKNIIISVTCPIDKKNNTINKYNARNGRSSTFRAYWNRCVALPL